MRTVLCLLCVLLSALTVIAQNMTIHMRDGRTNTYPLNDIEKITYDMPQRSTPRNIAGDARIDASTVLGPDYSTRFACDGSLQTGWLAKCSDNEWIRFSWSEPVTITRVVVVNRPQFGGSYDPILSSCLEFENGTTISLDPMNTYLSRAEARVHGIKTRWMRFKTLRGNGCSSNGGVAEIEIYGY